MSINPVFSFRFDRGDFAVEPLRDFPALGVQQEQANVLPFPQFPLKGERCRGFAELGDPGRGLADDDFFTDALEVDRDLLGQGRQGLIALREMDIIRLSHARHLVKGGLARDSF